MANESNLKKQKEIEERGREMGISCVRPGGLAASYFVSKYLARIVPVCRGEIRRQIPGRSGNRKKTVRICAVHSRESSTSNSIDLTSHALEITVRL